MMTTRTIMQTAMYRVICKNDQGDFDHGAAYLACFPGYGPEFAGFTQDGYMEMDFDGVIMPSKFEQLLDTDSQVVSYYQVAPLVYDDDE